MGFASVPRSGGGPLGQTSVAVQADVTVNGQLDLPGGGQWFCPVVAIGSARWRPVELPGFMGREASPPCLWWLG